MQAMHTTQARPFLQKWLQVSLICKQFCTHDETSNKELFPTFARTRPPDTQISKSVVSVLKTSRWSKVALFYKSSEDSEYAKVN